MGQEVLAQPGWNPLTSAASGAALAGLLAALVITVSIQIAFQQGRETAPDQSLSLKAAAPTLVTLLVASYLYIVLDGIPSSSTEVLDILGFRTAAVLSNPEALLGESQPPELTQFLETTDNYAALAARGFAIAGTTLALGALMALFIVVASVHDNTAESETQTRDWAAAVLLVAVFTLVVVLLLGYRVGAQAAGETPGAGWWLLHFCALVVPPSGAALRFRAYAPDARWWKSRMPKPLRASASVACMAVFMLATVPTVAVLSIVTIGPDGAHDVPLSLASFLSGLHFGAGAAVLLALLAAHTLPRRLQKPNGPSEDAATDSVAQP